MTWAQCYYGTDCLQNQLPPVGNYDDLLQDYPSGGLLLANVCPKDSVHISASLGNINNKV